MTLLVGSVFHMTRKIVSEMTYNVSMGTLNPTIPYRQRSWEVLWPFSQLAYVCLYTGWMDVFIFVCDKNLVKASLVLHTRELKELRYHNGRTKTKRWAVRSAWGQSGG